MNTANRADSKTSVEHSVDAISETVVYHDTVFSQALGVLPYQPLRQAAHVFRFQEARRRTFHTWFLFSPIDIVYVHNSTVIGVAESMPPFSTDRSDDPADTVVELPAGTARDKGIREGDAVHTQSL